MQSSSEHAGRRPSSGGISLQTLVIASAAAAVTSYIVSRIWGPGTLISAAATPVFVALVSEFLRRPVQTVSATAKRVPVVQRVPLARGRTASPSDQTVVDGGPGLGFPEEAPTLLSSAQAPTGVESAGRPRQRAQVPPIVDPGFVAVVEADEEEQAAGRSGPRWGLVLATGGIAFVIVVGVFTLPDLVAGRSITGNGSATTFFGGSTSSKPKSKTMTVTEPAATTVTTAAPTTTTTVPGESTTVPEPTTPAPTTTAPATTAPPPPTSSTTPPPTTAPPPTSTGSSIPVLPGPP